MGKTKYIIFLIIVIVGTAVLSWFSFDYFYDKKPTKTISAIAFYLQEGNKKVASENADNNNIFTVVNTSNETIDYKINITDNSKDVDTIDKQYLTFEVYRNNDLVKSGYMTELNGVLFEGEIKANTTDKFEFKVAVDNSVNLKNKEYKYNLKLEPIVE